jgi:hypothetical protein
MLKTKQMTLSNKLWACGAFCGPAAHGLPLRGYAGFHNPHGNYHA